jgi:hypothetical protein
MPEGEQRVTFYIGSDQVIEMQIEGTGSITGQAFRAILWDGRVDGGYVLSTAAGVSSIAISDPLNRLVAWTITKAAWPAGVREGTYYEWAIWRDEVGHDVPLAFGPAPVLRLPGA